MNVIGFDPIGMTDQELLDKTVEIHKRLAYAGRFSNSGELVEQLKAMADACAFAQRERLVQRAFEASIKGRPEQVDIEGPKPPVAKTNGREGRVATTRESSFRAARTSRPVKE
jgi:hypothetical protein